MAELIDQIKDLGITKNFCKDELLFSAGDKADRFFYVLSGEIRVYKMDEQGREVEVVRLGSGDFLGEAVLFVSPVFPAFAQAVKDSGVLFFRKDTVFQKIEKEPAMAKFLLTLLANKCVTLNKRIETLGLQTVRQRLIQYLLTRCSGEKKCLVELGMKKVELARILGTISETLSRNLRQMQEEEFIEVKGNKIYIKDCPRLREELIPGY